MINLILAMSVLAGPDTPPAVTKPIPKQTVEAPELKPQRRPATPEEIERYAQTLERSAEHLPPDKAARQLKLVETIRAGRIPVFAREQTVKDFEPRLRVHENMLKRLANSPPKIREVHQKQVDSLKAQIEVVKNPDIEKPMVLESTYNDSDLPPTTAEELDKAKAKADAKAIENMEKQIEELKLKIQNLKNSKSQTEK